MNICSVDGCDKEVRGHGFCRNHARNFTLYGDPLKVAQVQYHGLTTAERFLKYVRKDDDGCWRWTGSKRGRAGYGQFRMIDGSEVASRAAWMIFKGEIPKDDSAYGSKMVCHKCDHPECVNPDHLFLGTNQDNVTDKMEKNRHRYGISLGVSHGNAKMDEAKIRYIRGSLKTQSALAQEFGISQATIWAIIARKTWKHIT